MPLIAKLFQCVTHDRYRKNYITITKSLSEALKTTVGQLHVEAQPESNQAVNADREHSLKSY